MLEDADPALQPLVCPEDRAPKRSWPTGSSPGFRRLLAARGADLAFGRTLPRLLRETAWSTWPPTPTSPITGPACNELEGATVRTSATTSPSSTWIATDEGIDRHLANVATGRLYDLATDTRDLRLGPQALTDSASGHR